MWCFYNSQCHLCWSLNAVIYFFVSVIPTTCLHGCKCYYNQLNKQNIYNCTATNKTSLPKSIEKGTTRFEMSHVHLPMLCGTFDYLSVLTILDLRFCNISRICNNFLDNFNRSQSIILNLKNNSLTFLPPMITTLKRGSLMISGNHFECSCKMLWMVPWMINGTHLSKGPGHSVPDYKNVICYSGQKIGTPIYKLEEVDMNCYPHIIARWTVITLACLGTTLTAIGILVGAIIKRWNEIRWIVYKSFNKFIHQRGDQSVIEDVIFDAF